MHKIIVSLPIDRDDAGLLEVRDPKDKRVAGPYKVIGRADEQLARAHKNPGRNPLLPFGHMPSGEYRVAAILESGSGTDYGEDDYGDAGVVQLEPRNGDAALADANGRFRFLIQGGRPDAQGGLRPTDGSLRLHDADQRKLVRVLHSLQGGACNCLVQESESLPAKAEGVVARGRNPAARKNSPAAMPGVSRRSRLLTIFWLRTVMGATGVMVAVRSALGFAPAAPSVDPGQASRTVMSAKGNALKLPGRTLFTRGRLFAYGGGDYTQPTEQAPAPEEQAPAPEQQSPAPQEETPVPGNNTNAMNQLNNAEQKSQDAPHASTPEEAKQEAGQPFDQGGSDTPPVPVGPAPAAPAPVPSQEQTPAPEEETPAPEPEEETPAPEEETPAPEEETPAPEEETPAPEEETPAPEERPAEPEVQAPAVQSPPMQYPAAQPPAVQTPVPVVVPVPRSAPVVVPSPQSPAPQSVQIGGAAAVTGEVYWLTPSGKKVPIKPGTPIFMNEHVSTGPDGHLQVLLQDQTVFTVGANSDMVLDEFVYDPSTNAGKITAQIIKGVFRFVTGKMVERQPYNIKVNTDTDCLCFRGTDVEASIGPDKSGYIRLYKGKLDIVQNKTGAVFTVEAGHMVTLNADGSVGRSTPLK